MPGQTPILRRTTYALLQAVRRFMAGTDGSALIEFTIFVPIIVVMCIYVIDFGSLIWHKMQVQHAAQAGAQYAILKGFNLSNISLAVTNNTTYTSPSTTSISASPAPNQFYGCPSNTGVTSVTQNSNCPDGSVAGTYVTVSAHATHTPLLPYGLISSTYNLTAQATVRIQ